MWSLGGPGVSMLLPDHEVLSGVEEKRWVVVWDERDVALNWIFFPSKIMVIMFYFLLKHLERLNAFMC